MSKEKLSPLEFAKRYAEKSKVTLQFLAENDQVVVSCDCDHPTCEGWGMESENYIENCREGDIPLPDEIYSLKNLIGESP